MNTETRETLTKVPEVTLVFWIIKILATTLGETGGDAVSMSMNLGYLLSTAIFALVFIVAVVIQVCAKRFHPVIYWTTIIATTTVGTTLADFADRSLGVGYAGGAASLFILLMASLFIWHHTLGSVAVDTVNSPKSEVFYWITIMFSQTLGTALGDWMADDVCNSIRRATSRDCGDVLPDEDLSHSSILGSVHPYATAWRGDWRLFGQADK
jgi:uncharacterized membrane-anchored protein